MAKTQTRDQLRRAFRLINRLRAAPAGIPLIELAKVMRCDKVQVRRDAASLRRVGFKIDFMRHGRISIVMLTEDHVGWLPITRKEYDELLGLMHALQVMEHGGEYPAAASLFRKLERFSFSCPPALPAKKESDDGVPEDVAFAGDDSGSECIELPA